MSDRFVFLGTSASAGVPLIGCKCPICTSKHPHNQRLRPSGLLQWRGTSLLIDVGPDFRQQALREGIDRLDGLLLTHVHADHIAGIDDLRIFYVRSNQPIPCLLSKESAQDLHLRYKYLFERQETKSLTAQLDLQILEKDFGHTEFLGIKVDYLSYFQGGMKVNGFRIDDFAYISDIREYNPNLVFPALQGVQTLVLSALREEQSPLHLSLEEAVEFAKQVGAKKTWITHISHTLDHDLTNQKLPKDVQLAYDGLQVKL